MDRETIEELFGWMPQEGEANFRRIEADGKRFLQIAMPAAHFLIHACIPLEGRPDMSRPHGYETYLDFIRARLGAHMGEHGTDEGFTLQERDLEEVGDEILDFYRRRRFLLESATEAGQFSVAISDARHALELINLLDRYCEDEEHIWQHKKYEPYIRFHMVQARVLMHLEDQNYPAIVCAVQQGIGDISRFEVEHDVWEYDDIDESIYPAGLVDNLKELAVDVLEQAQEAAVDDEDYEEAAKLRDLLEEFRSHTEA